MFSIIALSGWRNQLMPVLSLIHKYHYFKNHLWVQFSKGLIFPIKINEIKLFLAVPQDSGADLRCQDSVCSRKGNILWGHWVASLEHTLNLYKENHRDWQLGSWSMQGKLLVWLPKGLLGWYSLTSLMHISLGSHSVNKEEEQMHFSVTDRI